MITENEMANKEGNDGGKRGRDVRVPQSCPNPQKSLLIHFDVFGSCHATMTSTRELGTLGSQLRAVENPKELFEFSTWGFLEKT